MLAGLLLYLALRGVDFAAVATALRQADYRWLLPLAFITLLSHWLRAFRWTLFLDALPEGAGPAKPTRTATAFSALMIGYMVNYAAPRLGEVARSANLAQRENVRFSRVLGTVVVERILDVFVLALALLSVLLLLVGRFEAFHTLFVEPLLSRLSAPLPLGALALAVVLTLGLLAAGVAYLRRRPAPAWWRRRVAPPLEAFREGLGTLTQTPRRAALVGSTVAIWACYALMAYLPLVLLGLNTAYGLGVVDAWVLMVLGALGVAVPSPGGVGSYHYITIQTLTLLFATTAADAATYAVLTHAAQLLLYVATGFVCLLLQGQGLRGLQAAPPAAARADGSE